MFVMLTGRPLFRGEGIQSILEANRKFETDMKCRAWESLSKEAREVCEALLEKEPEKRISAKEALKHPWFFEGSNLDEKVINR